jgi:hypothetical protein
MPESNPYVFCLVLAALPNSHKDLICWQLADELRRLIIEQTAEGTPAAGPPVHLQLSRRNRIACRNQSEGFYKYRHRQQRPVFNTARASLGGDLGRDRRRSRAGPFLSRNGETHDRSLRPRDDQRFSDRAVNAGDPSARSRRRFCSPTISDGAEAARRHRSRVTHSAFSRMSPLLRVESAVMSWRST